MKPALTMTDLTQHIGVLNERNNVLTKERDRLLYACREFVAATTFWEGAERYAFLESVLERMKDVVTVETEDKT